MSVHDAIEQATTNQIIQVSNAAAGQDYLLRRDEDGNLNQHYLHGPADFWWKAAHIDQEDWLYATCELVER
jgi:hypothetical protein